MDKFCYDVKKFDLASIVKRVFDTDNLEQLHAQQVGPNKIPKDPSKDQATAFHKTFYRIFDDENSKFLSVYKDLAGYVASLHFPEEKMVYQTRPTFRVQIPNNIAVAKWHKDKAYNHSEREINIYLPLTKAFDTNTVWAESEEDKGDYSPMNADLGEYYIWDGANLTHGNKKNTTGQTRVSIDFRLIPLRDFSYKGTSVTTKVPMKLGYYWELFE